jgi:Leucine-rich repeat (LRR) protein
LTNLTFLHLAINQIVDISPLSNLTNLTDLYLGNNQIIDISALSGLTNLKRLELYINEIVDISALEGLINLEKIELGNNQVSDISPLVNNPGIGSGDYVDLRNNYLALTPGSPDMLDIEALQSRGCDVDYEPQY